MNTKELQLVTFEQAKRLKELGFDLKSNLWYATESDHHNQTEAGVTYYSEADNTPDFSAPTVALALKWLRDVKGFFGQIRYSQSMSNYKVFNFNVSATRDYCHEIISSERKHETYEQAESALLDELLKLS